MPKHARAAAALLAAMSFAPLEASAQSSRKSGKPPSWDRRNGNSKSTAVDDDLLRESTERKKPSSRPWYKPHAALGAGLNFPELVPIEGYLFFGRYFALRGFYAPPIPINIRVEMPSDVIQAKNGLAVANPAYTIRAKATYGASYGGEALVFPFGGSFFLGAGASYREMRLRGEARSSVLACSLIEAAKEPPCGDPAARIETLTKLDITADAYSSAILLRSSLGWFWHVSDWGYVSMNLGMTKPIHVKEDVKIVANLIAPNGQNADLDEALGKVKAEREEDLEQKALKEMRPTAERNLPIAGLAAGVRF